MTSRLLETDGCLLVFVSMLFVASIRFMRQRGRRGEWASPAGGARRAQWTIVTISVVDLMFVVGTLFWGNPAPLFGISMIYKIVLGLGVLAAALTLVALVYSVITWAKRYGSVTGRLYYTLVTVAAVGFVWFLHNWNLLGWRF